MPISIYLPSFPMQYDWNLYMTSSSLWNVLLFSATDECSVGPHRQKVAEWLKYAKRVTLNRFLQSKGIYNVLLFSVNLPLNLLVPLFFSLFFLGWGWEKRDGYKPIWLILIFGRGGNDVVDDSTKTHHQYNVVSSLKMIHRFWSIPKCRVAM